MKKIFFQVLVGDGDTGESLQDLDQELLPQGRSSRVMLLLLARGEFRVLNIVILLSIYAAAILAIPLILASLFELSAAFVQLINQSVFATLLLSIYSEIQTSYFLIVISLFLGFLVTCLVSGMSIGRRMNSVDKGFSYLGISKNERDLASMGALLVVSLVSTALAFAFSFVFASASLYLVSVLLYSPYLTPGLSFPFWIYLVLIPFISFVALIAGWSRVRNS